MLKLNKTFKKLKAAKASAADAEAKLASALVDIEEVLLPGAQGGLLLCHLAIEYLQKAQFEMRELDTELSEE
jgi:hypothetical protein